jgi:hypothetical protein
VLLSYLLGRSNRLWLLPIVMLAWANLHGGFLAGLGALCLALALLICRNVNAFGFDRRLFTGATHLTLALVASGLVTLVNPQGWRLWQYVLTEVSHDTNRRYIAEWLPTLQAGDVWSTTTIALLTVILLITGWFAHRSRVALGGVRAWQWVLSCVPLVAMAFVSVRHIPLAAIWIAPVATLVASGSLKRENQDSWISRGWIALSSLATVPVILTVVAVSVGPWPRIYIAGNTLGSKHPCESVAFMRNHGLAGNVYAPLWWGSYITWQLFPSVRVSMDGRNISLFPDDIVVENLRFYSANIAEADVNAPLRYDTDYLLVPADRPVLERVLSDDRWQRVFTGSDSTLFARRGGALVSVKPLSERTPLMSTAACPAWMR